MKILFIQDNGINESLALTEVAGLLESKGHECHLLLEREEPNIIEKIKEISPDLFLIPTPLYMHKWALTISSKLKQYFNKLIVLGGVYPTFFPDIINDENIDIICRGEADLAILNLLDSLQQNKDIRGIKNLWVKFKGNIYTNDLRDLVEDFDSLPLPYRELYYNYDFIKDMSLKRFSSGRGCANSCSYCHNYILRKEYKNKGTYVRKKSVGRIIKEIKHIQDRYPLKSVHFSDDMFTIDKQWVIEFCEIYKREINLPFTCNSTADLLDEDIVRALKYGNCSGVAFGIETANEQLRISILNKNITNNCIIYAARLIKKYNMNLITFNMISLPGQNIDDIFQTIKLNHDIGTNFARISIASPVLGLEFTDCSIKKGYIDKDAVIREMDNFLNRPRIIFKTKYNTQFMNLFYLFRVGIAFPFLIPLIKRLIYFPFPKFFSLCNLLTPYFEKKIFTIDWLSGLRYFYHVGNPSRRTTNYASII